MSPVRMSKRTTVSSPRQPGVATRRKCRKCGHPRVRSGFTRDASSTDEFEECLKCRKRWVDGRRQRQDDQVAKERAQRVLDKQREQQQRVEIDEMLRATREDIV